MCHVIVESGLEFHFCFDAGQIAAHVARALCS